MFVPFDQLSAQAHIWIYQADKVIAPDEQEIVTARMTAFCQQWNSHDEPLQSSFQLFHNRFAVVGVNSHINKPGGCALDDSIRALKALQKELGIYFLDRTKVACWVQGKVETYSVQQLRELIIAEKITLSTPMFNNLITKKEDLHENWKVPIQSSWVAQSLLKMNYYA